ncbi:MAG TPA: hypothetical protein VFD81_17845 [Methylomirabilota bacterium]|jgi:hypothetical protein|nr:hypothetical protein [Methylomirabilota bacterium]
MLVQLLLRLIADAVFETASSRKRSYEGAIDRYLRAKGFVLPR